MEELARGHWRVSDRTEGGVEPPHSKAGDVTEELARALARVGPNRGRRRAAALQSRGRDGRTCAGTGARRTEQRAASSRRTPKQGRDGRTCAGTGARRTEQRAASSRRTPKQAMSIRVVLSPVDMKCPTCGSMVPFLLASTLLVAVILCPGSAAAQTASARRPAAGRLLKPDKAWVAERLRRMSLRDKVGQLVQVRAFGKFVNAASPEFNQLADEVRRNRVGGIVLFRRKRLRIRGAAEQTPAALAGAPAGFCGF